MTNREETNPRPEQDLGPAIEVKLIAPGGLGFGEGSIDVYSRIDKENGDLSSMAMEFVGNLLTTDNNSFKAVDAGADGSGDDGCGDGRLADIILRIVKGSILEEPIEELIYRAKIFGGGLVASFSMLRSILGSRPVKDEVSSDPTIGDDARFMLDKLEELGIKHGAHIDSHAEGEICGCGAIDNYKLITANVIKYKSQIFDVLKTLYEDEFSDNETAINDAFKTYGFVANNEKYFSNFSGKSLMEEIVDSGSRVTKLEGNHGEIAIVLNDVPGTTLDQRFITESVKKEFGESSSPVHVFCVDVWRGRQLAEVVAKIAKECNPSIDLKDAYKVAFADFLIRTLAVSATLTKGDLPVYSRRVVEHGSEWASLNKATN